MNYHHIDADRHAKLELPDGRLAASVRLSELRTELERLGVDGINVAMGKSTLLDAYVAFIERVAEELRPPYAKAVLPLPQETMRAAVAFIERQASA